MFVFPGDVEKSRTRTLSHYILCLTNTEFLLGIPSLDSTRLDYDHEALYIRELNRHQGRELGRINKYPIKTYSSMTVSDKAVSSAVQSFTSLAATMSAGVPFSLALANTSLTVEEATSSRSWLGTFGRLTLFLIKIIPRILYWMLTFTTITMPAFLFNLFSTSLTFTMNATTL